MPRFERRVEIASVIYFLRSDFSRPVCLPIFLSSPLPFSPPRFCSFHSFIRRLCDSPERPWFMTVFPVIARTNPPRHRDETQPLKPSPPLPPREVCLSTPFENVAHASYTNVPIFPTCSSLPRGIWSQTFFFFRDVCSLDLFGNSKFIAFELLNFWRICSIISHFKDI